jgi:voltage-gated sodium channel
MAGPGWKPLSPTPTAPTFSQADAADKTAPTYSQAVTADKTAPTYNRAVPAAVTANKTKKRDSVKDIEALNQGRSARSGSISEGGSDRQAKIKKFVDDILFDSVIGVIIVINAALMGMEVKEKLDGEVTLPYESLELIFTAIYVVEISLRLYSYGWATVRIPIGVTYDKFKRPQYKYKVKVPAALTDGWVQLDAILVVTAIMSLTAEIFFDHNVQTPLIMRLLRLFRLLRAVRLLVQFQTLYLLVRGLLNSVSVMLSTMVLMVLLVYIASLIITEFVTRPWVEGHLGPDLPQDALDLISEKYGSLWKTALTLIEITLLDDPSPKYRPIVEVKPMFAFVFFPIVLITGIVLMNLVTAVIVDRAMDSSNQEREALKRAKAKERDKLLSEISTLFLELDENGDGVLSLNEILAAPPEIIERMSEAIGTGSVDDDESRENFESAMKDLFTILDSDESKTINVEEFCSGISRVMNGTYEEDRRTLMHLEKLSVDMAHVLGLGARFQDEKTLLKNKLKQEVEEKFTEVVDSDNDGHISREEFDELHARLQERLRPPGERRASGCHKYDEICSLLERIVRPRSLETIDFEGIYRTLDVNGAGAVAVDDFLGCVLMHCENNQSNDRQIFIKIEKMVSAMKSESSGFREEVRKSSMIGQHILSRSPTKEWPTMEQLHDANLDALSSKSSSKDSVRPFSPVGGNPNSRPARFRTDSDMTDISQVRLESEPLGRSPRSAPWGASHSREVFGTEEIAAVEVWSGEAVERVQAAAEQSFAEGAKDSGWTAVATSEAQKEMSRLTTIVLPAVVRRAQAAWPLVDQLPAIMAAYSGGVCSVKIKRKF